MFLTTPDEIQSTSSENSIHLYNIKVLILFDPEMQLINTKQVVQNKLKALLNELKNFKVQKTLVFDYKKGKNSQIFHSNTKLTASDSHIDAAFKFIHQYIMTKIKKYACKDWIALDAIIEHKIRSFEC